MHFQWIADTIESVFRWFVEMQLLERVTLAPKGDFVARGKVELNRVTIINRIVKLRCGAVVQG